MILNEEVEVKWNYKTRKHYESKGYKFTGYRKPFTVKVSDLPTTSHRKLEVKCDYCDKIYEAKYVFIVEGREAGVIKEACSDCRHLKQSEVKYGELRTVGNTPELLQTYSDKNTLDPNRLTLYSGKRVWWNCKNGHDYLTTVNKRSSHDCPYCKNRKVWVGYNDLASQFPAILEYWDHDKNKLKPTELVAGSHKKVYLKCGTCTGEWLSKVYDAVKDTGEAYCPYCSNDRVLTGFNDFATRKPEFLDEWFCDKSQPENTLHNSSFPIKWKCRDCKNIFARSPDSRKTDYCPYCSGAELKKGFNDITVTNILGAKDWSNENAITADNFTRFSQEIAYWKCVTCSHEWKEEIRTKLHRKVGCPNCSLSSGERQVKKLLLELNVKFEEEFIFKDLKGIGDRALRFDFAIFNKNNKLVGIIEYDGGQHFKSVDFYGGKKTLQRIQKHDTIKNVYCLANKIPLLRLRYTISEQELVEETVKFVKDITKEEK